MVKLEKEVWQPMAESMVQAGVTSGWSVNVQVLPGGTDLPFQAVTVDVYPSWDAVFAGNAHVVEHFKKDIRHGIWDNHGENRETAHHCVEEAVYG